MDDQIQALCEKRQQHLQQAAELSVEIDRANGTIPNGVPHYSLIEQAAHEVGQKLAVEVQKRHMNEVVARYPVKDRCPECNNIRELKPDQRTVLSIDGNVELQELKAHCPSCRKDFFPDEDNSRI